MPSQVLKINNEYVWATIFSTLMNSEFRQPVLEHSNKNVFLKDITYMPFTCALPHFFTIIYYLCRKSILVSGRLPQPLLLLACILG